MSLPRLAARRRPTRSHATRSLGAAVWIVGLGQPLPTPMGARSPGGASPTRRSRAVPKLCGRPRRNTRQPRYPMTAARLLSGGRGASVRLPGFSTPCRRQCGRPGRRRPECRRPECRRTTPPRHHHTHPPPRHPLRERPNIRRRWPSCRHTNHPRPPRRRPHRSRPHRTRPHRTRLHRLSARRIRPVLCGPPRRPLLRRGPWDPTTCAALMLRPHP